PPQAGRKQSKEGVKKEKSRIGKAPIAAYERIQMPASGSEAGLRKTKKPDKVSVCKRPNAGALGVPAFNCI
ncbi:MAG: hypothetical protein RBS09_06775, partial [Anaerolineaceae bacterium]|nr:hypothetical protein [Anaerolineaceae bacterium]